MNSLRRLLLCGALIAGIPWLAEAAAISEQQATAPQAQTGSVRLFFDCPEGCDETFLRSEVTFVDYMRDRRDADVHLLVTTQDTGGGGREYTLQFIGLGRFAGINQTLKYVAPQTATSDERRTGVTETVKKGLVRYAAETPAGSRLRVTFTADTTQTGQANPTDDRWNLWVFNAGVGGSINGEQSTGSHSFRGSVSANRTTDEWKLSFEARTNYRESRFELGEGETFRTISRNVDVNALTVKSLGPHWSAAIVANAGVSSFLNHDFRARIAPGIEYNIFPYDENTRRRLTFQYTLGASRFDYDEITIYDKLTETLPDHKLRTMLSMKQPWGNTFVSVNFSQYLSQPDKYSISTFGEANVRLFKGFTFDVFGEVARTRDQIYLQRGEASTEEILVQQRQLATGYQYFVSFGVSYSFGSIFNNVVNPRFDGF